VLTQHADEPDTTVVAVAPSAARVIGKPLGGPGRKFRRNGWEGAKMPLAL
jgi:hypothetical protein